MPFFDETLLQGIDKEIEEILLAYVKVESISNTPSEKQAEAFFQHYFSTIPYFKNTPGSYGAYPIQNDPLNRCVSYAMLRGTGKDTVVLVHHNDTVTVEDFKLLQKYAFSPLELMPELMKIKSSFSQKTQRELESGDFLFGRGVADMKGGGAIQIALLKRYSEQKNFPGNIVLLAVPDEENLSAGMIGAVHLLHELQEEHGLNYRLIIDSESHKRTNPALGAYSEGSVGKIMPFIYVRGFLTHSGNIFDGLNPISVMSKVVRKTEVNMYFSDIFDREAAPPPTWLYFKDGKSQYDVSIPLSAKGCFSILTLNQTPQGILDKVRKICEDAFDDVIDNMNNNYRQFAKATNKELKYLPWDQKVITFKELYAEAAANYGDKFTQGYESKLQNTVERLRKNEVTTIDANFELVEFVYDYIDDVLPRIVYGLVPPYYPNVHTSYIQNLDPVVQNLGKTINDYTKQTFGQTYVPEHFYTGISDLSYTSIQNSAEIRESLETSMPLFETFYHIPIDLMEKISMPGINIGPWGEDLHEVTERVYKEDLLHRTPGITNRVIASILQGE